MDGSKETIQLTKDIIPETTSYGVKISGDSMEPEFENGKIAWVLKQYMVENGRNRYLLSNNLITRSSSRVYSLCHRFLHKTISRVECGERAPSAEFMLQIATFFNLLAEDVFKVSTDNSALLINLNIYIH